MISDPRIRRAKRWAERIAQEKSPLNKARCQRQMMRVLFSALPPKPDGTHPLDADQLKLEGV